MVKLVKEALVIMKGELVGKLYRLIGMFFRWSSEGDITNREREPIQVVLDAMKSSEDGDSCRFDSTGGTPGWRQKERFIRHR